MLGRAKFDLLRKRVLLAGCDRCHRRYHMGVDNLCAVDGDCIRDLVPEPISLSVDSRRA